MHPIRAAQMDSPVGPLQLAAGPLGVCRLRFPSEGGDRFLAWFDRHFGVRPRVGSAVGANPVPILVPCHRVVGRDGSLTGFGGGVETKKRLLAIEGAGS